MHFLFAASSSLMIAAPEGTYPTTSQVKSAESDLSEKTVKLSHAPLTPTPARLLSVRIAAVCLYVTNLVAQREMYEKLKSSTADRLKGLCHNSFLCHSRREAVSQMPFLSFRPQGEILNLNDFGNFRFLIPLQRDSE